MSMSREQLWADALVACLKVHGSASCAVTEADAALKAFDQRFGDPLTRWADTDTGTGTPPVVYPPYVVTCQAQETPCTADTVKEEAPVHGMRSNSELLTLLRNK